MRKLKADKILDQIKELYKELHSHQSKCKHTRVTTVSDGYGKTKMCEVCKFSWFIPYPTDLYSADQ